MITYQLDECTNWKILAESCEQEGLVKIRKFPKRLVSQKDSDVLGFVYQENHTLLTTDRQIHWDFTSSFQANHPGILIVAHHSPLKTATRKSIIGTLGRFKSSFPEWPKVSLRNSVVEVTDNSVEVSRVFDEEVTRSLFVKFDENNWQARLSDILLSNANDDLLLE